MFFIVPQVFAVCKVFFKIIAFLALPFYPISYRSRFLPIPFLAFGLLTIPENRRARRAGRLEKTTPVRVGRS